VALQAIYWLALVVLEFAADPPAELVYAGQNSRTMRA